MSMIGETETWAAITKRVVSNLRKRVTALYTSRVEPAQGVPLILKPKRQDKSGDINICGVFQLWCSFANTSACAGPSPPPHVQLCSTWFS